MEAGKLLTKLNLHRFWATLDYTNPPDGAEWDNVAVGELAQWESVVDEVASLGESSIRSCTRLLQYYLHPEAEDIREPKENAVPKGRPRRRSNARDPSWFEKVTPRKSKTKGAQSPAGDSSCPYVMYIPPSVRPLLSTWFDPEPDGNCGFRAIAHYYFGDQERYMEIRGYLVHEIEAHWDIYYSMLYLQTLAQVKDKVGSKSGPCGQDHWMDDIDLLGITTLFNWSIVVYAWGYGKAFGRTYLPLSVGPGVSRPTSIVSLVNNGTHWVLVQLADVDGVYALPEFHGMWTGIHNHHEGKVEAWEAMYDDERQLYVNRGGDD
ncbi:hypothetical protein LINGRAHAP2_LOCUS10663 [Linum grandiflorum]